MTGWALGPMMFRSKGREQMAEQLMKHYRSQPLWRCIHCGRTFENSEGALYHLRTSHLQSRTVLRKRKGTNGINTGTIARGAAPD